MCKRFPPHLNNVSTLPGETWNAHCARAIIDVPLLPICYQKKPPEFIPLQLWSPNSLDLNPVDNSVWEILQEKVYKTRITDLEPSATPLMNACRNDDMIQLGPLRSQSLFQFIQITDAYVLQQSSHAGESGGHRWGGINLGVFLCYKSMIARVWRAFQV